MRVVGKKTTGGGAPNAPPAFLGLSDPSLKNKRVAFLDHSDTLLISNAELVEIYLL